ncbi:hypothetical protein [Streptomyces sp. NPDC021020]|uniref:hypothetical protein n=1 Tax=Streptomyces sp. NPDC021020 TaxID=3365109 RepID=UPI00378B7F55
MYRSEANDDRVRALQNLSYENLRKSFRARVGPVYCLRTPWLEPCTLAEHHTFNGTLQSLTLAYGSWDTNQPHVKVTTWRDLLGQSYAPDVPSGLDSARPEDLNVDIENHENSGVLLRQPSGAWLLRVDLGSFHLVSSGRGPVGDLSFDPLADLEQVIEARRAYLASRFPRV